jgi:hypothetical protein
MHQLSIDSSPLSSRFPGWRFDVSAWLPDDYAEQCLEVSREHGRLQRLTGHCSTSRSRAFGDDTVHNVVVTDGLSAMDRLPWLEKLYSDAFLHLANRIAGAGTYRCSDNKQVALNINCLPVGEMYEWHVDSNELTGLLFCPTGDFTGGELMFRADPASGDEWVVTVRPEPGLFLLFDARPVPHCVRPCSVERVTVPMNYYLMSSDESSLRPHDLDAYLYESLHDRPA